MTTTATNGQADASQRPASFIQKDIAARLNVAAPDPNIRVRGSAPNRGQFPLPHTITFQGLVSSIAKVYRPSDEAINASLDNARFMRNDVGIMECLEARQRAVSLLNWHLEPEDEHSPDQKALCEELTKLLDRIPSFLDYRYNLLHALWYGRYGIQHQYRWTRIGGRSRVLPQPHPINGGLGWLPINGDKLVFRHDDARYEAGQFPGQVGIRVASRFKAGETGPDDRHQIEATDRGLAYFLAPWERRLVAIHKHMIEDGAYESISDGGMIHGIGIRSRIYWDWFQKQEALAFLMEYLERSAGGIELWYYDEGNPEAKRKTEEAALQRLGGQRNVITVPRPRGEDAMAYGVEVIEPGMAGIDALKDLLVTYFGHRIKRYILGQVLSSEAEATGLGSGVAELHLDTFLQIIRYDARKLEETITQELIENLKNWNFPAARDIRVKFKIETESAQVEEKLNAWKAAYDMGCRLKENDVMELIGAEMPGPDDRALQNPQLQQQAAPGMFGGMGPGQQPPAAVAPPKSPEQITQELTEGVMQSLYGSEEAQNPDGQAVAYVSEGGEWQEREIPSGEHDTGDRARAGVYAKFGDKCPVCPSCGSENTSHARTKGSANAECQECGKQFVDPKYGRSKSADEAAAETDRNPSDEQRASGNYRKGKFRAHGLTIAIETPKGAERRGKNREGQEWSVTMPCHYGYITRTEGKDGDHIDVFVGPNPESEIVFVVDQTTNGGRFDEHKVLIGFTTEADARAAYLGAYSDDAKKRIRGLTSMTTTQLKAWLESGDLKQPLADQVSRYRREPDRYDRPASLDAIPDSVGKKSESKKGGSWVRLGGGAPAFVGPDGTIKKGCPGLKGENVEDLIDEDDESRDRRAAKQAHAESKGLKGHEVTATEARKWEGQGAQRQHDAAKAAAKRHGVNVADVIQGLPEALELRTQQWQQTEQARAAARRLAGMNAGNLARVENAYRDYSSVPGFDEAAASFAMEHPEMGLGRSGDVAAELWDFIREGAAPKPAIHDEETADVAAGMVGRRGQESEQPEGDFADEWASEDDSFDPSRFRRGDASVARYDSPSWDESKHPRGQPGNPGQFGPGGGSHSPSESAAAPEKTVAEKPGELRTPTTHEHAKKLAEFLRNQWTDYEGDEFDDADHNRCMDAALMIKAIFPEAVLYRGVMEGDWEEGGEHKIARVGDFYYDITSAQFFENQWLAFSEEDRLNGDFQEYRNFKPWKHPDENRNQYRTRAEQVRIEGIKEKLRRSGIVSRYSWNEADHPRGQPENAGQFSPTGGRGAKSPSSGRESWDSLMRKALAASAKPLPDERSTSKPSHKDAIAAAAKSPEHAKQLKAAHLRLGESLRSSSITPEQRQRYFKSASAAMTKMSTGALKRLLANTERFEFVGSMEEVAQAQARMSGQPAKAGQRIAAFCRIAKGQRAHLVLDGGTDTGEKGESGTADSDLTSTHVYAHEMAHAIDNHEYSRDPEWRQCYGEIVRSPNPPSQYATRNDVEAFAEFGRLAMLKPDVAEKNFPKCWQFWKSRGLV